MAGHNTTPQVHGDELTNWRETLETSPLAPANAQKLNTLQIISEFT
jgi:hypothetical protein